MTLAIMTITALISYCCFSRPDLVNKLALWPYRMVRYNEWQRLITHMFVHSGWTHLLVNMFVFYSFAEALQYYLDYAPGGRYWQTIMLYFGGGVASALISTVRRKNDAYYLSIGASAGVSSLIFASICFQPWAPIYFFGVLPIPGIALSVAYLVYSYHMSKQAGQNIDHMAHFYGAIFGLVYPMITMRGAFTNFISSLIHGPWL